MTTARVATTNMHDINHVTNPIKPDNMALTESDSHADTTCAGNKMTPFHILVTNATLTDSTLT